MFFARKPFVRSTILLAASAASFVLLSSGLAQERGAVEVAAASYRQASPDDRLAGSYPFLTMCSVLVAGWLFERQANVVGDSEFHAAKRAAADYFNSVVVPEARGLAAGAEAGAAMLYAVSAGALA